MNARTVGERSRAGCVSEVGEGGSWWQPHPTRSFSKPNTPLTLHGFMRVKYLPEETQWSGGQAGVSKKDCLLNLSQAVWLSPEHAAHVPSEVLHTMGWQEIGVGCKQVSDDT